jgi:hypothetical protein
LREPLARFVSNYYYDLHNGYTPARSLNAYMGSRQRAFTMDNYYCRILSGHDNNLVPVDEDQYRLAVQRLTYFDHCMDLHSGFATLSKELGWSTEVAHANAGSRQMRVMLSRFLKLKWGLLFLQLRYPRRPASSDFERTFRQTNHWDQALLKNISQLPKSGA